jgi:hypothetical protein
MTAQNPDRAVIDRPYKGARRLKTVFFRRRRVLCGGLRHALAGDDARARGTRSFFLSQARTRLCGAGMPSGIQSML